MARLKQSWEDGDQSNGRQQTPLLAVQALGTWRIPAEKEQFLHDFRVEIDRVREGGEPVEV